MLPPVLVGVVKENLELVVLALSLVVVLVVVGRKTPLVAMKEVVLEFARDVLFNRQDAGIVKQHGKPLEDEVLGWSTPL